MGQVPSLLDAVLKTTKISKALQAIRAGPSDGAGTVSSQFARVQRNYSLDPLLIHFQVRVAIFKTVSSKFNHNMSDTIAKTLTHHLACNILVGPVLLIPRKFRRIKFKWTIGGQWAIGFGSTNGFSAIKTICSLETPESPNA